MNTPLVSIICCTYNHGPYIRECLDGFMIQKTDFPIEVLIHDDASTDSTADIIKEFEEKYPSIIKPIYAKENRYSQGIDIFSQILLPKALGKYIAICEGDDYWTDSFKLQKQVDFLELNKNCSVCCHKYILQESNQIVICNDVFDDSFFHIEEYIDSKQWIIQPLTAVFRSSCYNNQEFMQYKCSKDVTLFYYLLNKGNAYKMSDVMGVYRLHDQGTFSQLDMSEKLLGNFKTVLSISLIDKSLMAAKYLKGTVDDVMSAVGLRFIAKNLMLFIKADRQLSQYFEIHYVYKLIIGKIRTFFFK